MGLCVLCFTECTVVYSFKYKLDFSIYCINIVIVLFI